MADQLAVAALNILKASIFVPLALLFMVLAQWCASRLYRVEYQTVALAWRNTGIWVAVSLGMMAALTSHQRDGFSTTLQATLFAGVITTVFILAAQAVNDYLIVTGLNNSDAISNNNVAVGIVEFGGLTATGLNAFGSFWGVSKDAWFSAVVFFLLGQVCLVLIFRIFDALHPVELLEKIRQGNVSAAIVVAGVLVSLGLVIKTAVSGEFSDPETSFWLFMIYTAVGVLLLLATYWAVGRIVFWKTCEENEINADNVARALQAALGQVAVVFIMSALI